MSKQKNKKIKVALMGAGGKMGQAIFSEILLDDIFEPFLAVTNNRDFNLKFLNQKKSINEDILKKCDVLIDFSSIEGFESSIKMCMKLGIPFVSGTTGLTLNEKKLLIKASKIIPVLWAPNMSIGIHLVAQLIGHLNKIKDWDFQITEIHHNKKKDSPSGTGLFLQNKLLEAVQRKIPSPLSIRGGGVFGDHSILAMSDSEIIEIKHRALNRNVFAKGALLASKWILVKGPGLYSMENVLQSL
jgi:4-hydroxy-tetrahydrodipicolinate reductase